MTRTLYVFDQGLKGLVGHYYEYVRSIVDAARAQGIRCVVGCHEEAGDGSFASFELHSVFRDDVWGTISGEDYHSAASMNGVSERFLEDIGTILRKHPIRSGDIIFLPNIAKPHVVAMALVAEKFGPMGVRTHFMFRYPSGHFGGETAANSFRRLEAAAARYEVSLCTDSHRLADELTSLSSLPFTVFPIPHTWHSETKKTVSDDRNRPLHCVSLGNARDEKGMAEILEAVRLSSHEAWGKNLSFTLQVNDPYQVEDAIEAFKQGSHDPRTTLIEEAMSSEEYVALLDSADVVLVPYWRSIYRERTSGVFMEGVITGKLVLCTRDTWMSDLFDLHQGGAAVDDRSGPAICEGLRQLVEQREDLQARAEQAAKYWQAIHCPDNLVAHLVGKNARPVLQKRQGGKAAVLFPWGEAVSGKTGAALRLKYFVRYMESVYDEVRILFAGGSESGGIIGKRSRADALHYTEETKQLHEQLKAVCRNIGVPEEQCFHLWYHLWPQNDKIFNLQCEEIVLWADHVYVDYTYFCPVVDKLCRLHGKDYTLTLFDIVSDQSEETLFLHQATRAFEFESARNAPRVICASACDHAALAREGVHAEIIPHPIDTQEAIAPFSQEEARACLEDLFGLPASQQRLCFFVGSFYPPNVEAAEEIAAMARRCQGDPQFRDLHFVVAGGCMEPGRTENFSALGMIEGAALSAIMEVADVVLVPLQRGTGVSLKSVEGLARGALLLSTSVGMRGLDVTDGVHCLIEDDVAKYPDRIAAILADGAGAQGLRAAAREFGEKFDFRRLMALYLPGSRPAHELAETAEEFARRREDSIKELLPRIRAANTVSPVLRNWLDSFDGGGAPVQNWKAKADSLTPVEAEPRRDPVAPAHPVAEDQTSDAFDAAWYLKAYPDVAMLGMDPAEHYAWIGKELGRATNAVKKNSEQPLTSPATDAGGTRRWFLADPSLVDSAGHCARYLLSLAGPLRRRGEVVHVLGNRTIDQSAADLADCEPAFALRCEDMPIIPGVDSASPTGIESLRRRRANLLRSDLDHVSDRHHLTSADVLLINSLRHWSLEDVVEWLEAQTPDRRPLVVLVLHYTPFPQANVRDSTTAAYRDGFKAIANSAVGERILVCTDSERLAAQYTSLSDVPVHVLPIPHGPTATAHVRDGAAPLSVGFAGEARHDKGYHLLPQVVRKILEEEPARNIVFDFQAYWHGADGQLDWTVHDQFRSLEAVRLLCTPLSEEDYEAFIAGVDLMLIPYLHGPYHAQTSGVYCEAAAMGTPVVIPRNTWMADQVARNGGGVMFDAGDADSLARAALEAIRDFSALSQSAREAAPAWRAFHNAENLVACLEALLPALPRPSNEGSFGSLSVCNALETSI